MENDEFMKNPSSEQAAIKAPVEKPPKGVEGLM
jgi:hypothetical protein